MGTILSSFQGEDDEATPNPLPPPQVSSNIFLAPLAAHEVIRRAPPTNVRVDKQRLPFMIERNSLKVETLNGCQVIQFKYKSTDIATCTIASTIADDERIVEVLAPTTLSSKEDLCHAQYREKKLNLFPGRHLKSGDSIMFNIITNDDKFVIEGIFQDDVVKIKSMGLISPSGLVDLQQLYDASGASGNSTSYHSSEGRMCAICLSNRISVGFIPCRHVCVCTDCADTTLLSSENHCPICRSVVTGKISLG
jgi:hypothetical protein